MESLLLSEQSQSEKATCCMIPSIRHPGKDKAVKTVEMSVDLQEIEVREGEG